MTRLLYEFRNPTNPFFLSPESVKRIKMISENNEIVRPYNNATLEGITVFQNDRINNSFNDPLLSPTENMKLYQGSAKSNIDNDYRSAILNSANLGFNKDVIFMNYAVDGHDNSRFAYKYYRETQTLIDGQPYSTPDIYMQQPTYWHVDDVGGDNHGWRFMARARNTELIKDEFDQPWYDKWTAPYVSAGWNVNSERDMRPGQYLGLLKSVALSGANFFHPGYFNQASPEGKAYCWQVAMPVYAQAINSRIYDFINEGEFLFGDYPWNLGVTNPSAPTYKHGFRFNTDNPNELIVARKMNTSEIYAITGTVQSNSGYAGTFELDATVTINLKNNSTSPPVYNLTFPIRRQGSTYIFDNSIPTDPAFWQLDAWHQYEHPERWSKDFAFEAEVLDNLEATATRIPLPGVEIHTEDNAAIHIPIASLIFTNFTSYVTFTTPTPLEYRFQPREDGVDNDYHLYIKARSKINGNLTGFNITLTDVTTNTAYGYWWRIRAK
jgi:hypothetical protein